MNIFLLSIVIFISINNPIAGKNKRLTKTYCLSSSGTSLCSKDNLVSATWSVVERPCSRNDVVKLTLSTANVKRSETKSMSLIFRSSKFPSTLTNYTCSRSPSGTTAFAFQEQRLSKGSVVPQGTTSYSRVLNYGKLTCSWTFEVDWTLYFNDPDELISDKTNGYFELKSADKSQKLEM